MENGTFVRDLIHNGLLYIFPFFSLFSHILVYYSLYSLAIFFPVFHQFYSISFISRLCLHSMSLLLLLLFRGTSFSLFWLFSIEFSEKKGPWCLFTCSYGDTNASHGLHSNVKIKYWLQLHIYGNNRRRRRRKKNLQWKIKYCSIEHEK